MQLGRRRRLIVSSPARNVAAGKNALTASGQRVRRKQGDDVRRLIQPWQSRSFAYYNMLGEIKYAAQFYARGLSQLRLYAAELDQNGDWVETKNEQAIAALERVQDPGGGRTGLLASYGRLMFLAGECLLFVSKDPETHMEQWEMLSTDELRIQGDQMVRFKAPSLAAVEYREPSDDDYEEITGDRDAVAYRLWQRHPQYSMLADSTMQGVLDLCEELVLLTQSVRARARSRLAGSGILFIPTELSPAPLEPAPDEDPAEDPFLSDLTEAMTTPIVDEGAASAIVPLVVRGDAEYIEKVRHIQIIDPTQVYPETGLRYECIKRIAIGLDMPPEILMGLGDSNHWSAWQVDEQTWKGHLQPKAQQLVDDLTAAYYRPALKEAGLADWDRYAVMYDATAVINHPDRTKDAKDLHKVFAISDKALREAGGFDEEDAITDAEELARRIGVAVGDGTLALTGEPDADNAPASERPDTATVDGGRSSAEVEKLPPEEPAERDEPLPETVLGSNGHSASLARILGAADLALLRAREAAGNRIKSAAKRDPEAQRAIDGVRAGQVAAVLGRDRVRALKVGGEPELVSGARELILDALRMWDIGGDDVLERIAENVMKHAAMTLYDERPAPLPPSFTNYVTGLVGAR